MGGGGGSHAHNYAHNKGVVMGATSGKTGFINSSNQLIRAGSYI